MYFSLGRNESQYCEWTVLIDSCQCPRRRSRNGTCNGQCPCCGRPIDNRRCQNYRGCIQIERSKLLCNAVSGYWILASCALNGRTYCKIQIFVGTNDLCSKRYIEVRRNTNTEQKYESERNRYSLALNCYCLYLF